MSNGLREIAHLDELERGAANAHNGSTCSARDRTRQRYIGRRITIQDSEMQVEPRRSLLAELAGLKGLDRSTAQNQLHRAQN